MRKQWLAAAVVAVGLGSGSANAADVNLGTLKFSGKVFSDFSFKENVDDTTHATSPDSGVGADVKRFYLTADWTYNDFLSARIRTDIGDQGTKRYDVFVKHAYIQLKFAPEAWLRLGSADLPWVPWVEDRYGFRYVENVLIDRTGFGTSADWGLHLGGDIMKKLLSYQVSVVNGRGYSNPTRSQAPTVEARISTQPIENLYIGVGGEIGTLGQKMPGVPTAETAKRVDGLVTWSNSRLKVGASGFYGKNATPAEVTGKAPADSSLGFSGWASVLLAEQLKPTVFGRFDWVQPSKDVNPDLKDTYFNAGVEITPWAPLQVAAVYKRDHVSTGALPGAVGTTNGSIGSKSANSGGSYDEVGVFTQLNF